MTDDNKAHLDTEAWIRFRMGKAVHSREIELLILCEMFSAADPRPDPDYTAWRHRPVFPSAGNTLCELCGLTLNRSFKSESGWQVAT